MIDPRSRVLAAVRDALEDVQGSARPLPTPTRFAESSDTKLELARQFMVELEAVAGKAFVVRDRSECVAALASYLRGRQVQSIAVQSRQLARDTALQLDGFKVSPATTLTREELERCDCGLLEARALFADTGSAAVIVNNALERMLPYLPRTCALVAELRDLHSTLTPTGFACIADAASSGARGEALIVTGPSKTADIEKTLVLGAHGPEALAVFIIEQP